jgi:hypothetical protein
VGTATAKVRVAELVWPSTSVAVTVKVLPPKLAVSIGWPSATVPCSLATPEYASAVDQSASTTWSFT